jgi:quercetin dioxygenase-like cupin family protein
VKKLAIAVAAAALALASAYARTGLDVLFAQTPAEMKFVADPAHAGYETAVVVGDPSQGGVYAVHTRLPANITIVPHTHGEKWRIATVLSGTLHYAQGDTFDEKKLRPLPPGSVIVEPADVPHFARTGAEPVLLHIVGEGPASTVPVGK